MLPYTADATSNPLPILPCAAQWQYCARLCTSASALPPLNAALNPALWFVVCGLGFGFWVLGFGV